MGRPRSTDRPLTRGQHRARDRRLTRPAGGLDSPDEAGFDRGGRSTMGNSGSGTKVDPWQLKTPPGTSDYQMWRDEAADPPTLVCQVGSTQLKYDLRCIDDLHVMLKAHGDWMPL